MLTYQHHSLSLRNNITQMTGQSLGLIRKLDKKVKQLCFKLDAMILDLDNSEDSISDLEEIALLKRAIEVITIRKMQLAIKNYDFLDQNVRMVDNEMTLLEKDLRLQQSDMDSSSGGVSNIIGTEKKRKHSNSVVPVMQIDPNEPVYCTCKRIAFGDMIACDNDACIIEWFHYECVNMIKKPRNSWLCPDCSAAKRKAAAASALH